MITGIGVNIVTEYHAILISFVAFFSCCVCASIVMAVAVNLYPTNYRAMATAFIMMFGRIGGVSGSSIIGLLLEHHCPSIFYLFGGTLISKCYAFDLNRHKIEIFKSACKQFYTLILGCAVVFVLVEIKSR